MSRNLQQFGIQNAGLVRKLRPILSTLTVILNPEVRSIELCFLALILIMKNVVFEINGQLIVMIQGSNISAKSRK